MAVFQMGGVNMPSPSGLEVEIVALSSGDRRNAAGESVVDFLGVKRRIRAAFSHLSQADMATLAGCAAEIGFVSVTYPDPALGEDRTGQFRVESFSGGVFRAVGNHREWSGVTMTLMEK